MMYCRISVIDNQFINGDLCVELSSDNNESIVVNYLYSEYLSIGYINDGIIIEFLDVTKPDVIFIDYNSYNKLWDNILKLIKDKIIYIEEDI